VSTAEREVIDPDRGQLTGHRVWHGADQAQHRRPAHRHREPLGQPRPGAAGEQQRDRLQHRVQ
jgi:hypothetical protein